MSPERRFVLADFICPVGRDLRLYEAGRSYPMPPAVAHAAAKRDLVAHHKPPYWTPPSLFKVPEVLTAKEMVEAEAELQALEHHAAEPLELVSEG